MDAHRREVFSALYRVTQAPAFEPERLAEIDPPAVGDPSATLTRWMEMAGGSRWILIGDGAILYADAIRRRAPDAAIGDPPPLAAAIGRLAVARAARGETVGPAGVRPLYVRRPDAEIAREKKGASYEERKGR